MYLEMPKSTGQVRERISVMIKAFYAQRAKKEV